MNKEIEIAKYLEAITGKKGVLRRKRVTLAADLPRYVTSLYELDNVMLLGIPVVFASLKTTTVPSVVDLERHYEMLKSRIQTEVVFVGDNITARTAERLLRRRIPHVITGKQLFLPFLFLDIKSGGTRLLAGELPETAKLSQWAEALVIRQLLRKDLDGVTGAELARDTEVSAMTTNRAINQLTSANLCHLEQQGRKKILRFDDVQSLWDKAAKILLPPLSKTVALAKMPKGFETFVSGTSALARSTLLAEDEIPVFATSHRNFSLIAQMDQVPLEDAKLRLEIWDRDPALTAERGVVDPISLYLNMRHGDERVRIALTELLGKFGLGDSSD
jgi:hypothetical protein